MTFVRMMVDGAFGFLVEIQVQIWTHAGLSFKSDILVRLEAEQGNHIHMERGEMFCLSF